MNIETASAIMTCLGSPIRLRIFHLLSKVGERGLAVGDLQTAVDIPGPTLSHHLARLEDVGLLTRERRGTTLICRADPAPLAALTSYLARTAEAKRPPTP